MQKFLAVLLGVGMFVAAGVVVNQKFGPSTFSGGSLRGAVGTAPCLTRLQPNCAVSGDGQSGCADATQTCVPVLVPATGGCACNGGAPPPPVAKYCCANLSTGLKFCDANSACTPQSAQIDVFADDVTCAAGCPGVCLPNSIGCMAHTDCCSNYCAGPVGSKICQTLPPGPACSNAIDDDGDAIIDFPGDTGCSSPTDTTEFNTPPQCSDSVDNDLDSFFDYPNDSGCSNATDNDESNPPTSCTHFDQPCTNSPPNTCCSSICNTNNKCACITNTSLLPCTVGTDCCSGFCNNNGFCHNPPPSCIADGDACTGTPGCCSSNRACLFLNGQKKCLLKTPPNCIESTTLNPNPVCAGPATSVCCNGSKQCMINTPPPPGAFRCQP